ncbi:TSUP family transporter [Blattabacterium cuenoti]|uniref:TSUP family transporter n=1 Tax=Blattabacterium cuenoti TaxID=1653831 RepID=UPI00163BBE7E|nr:TSUP family transporter [Blattabacterium cuenoti]
MNDNNSKEENRLLPIFLHLERLSFLIIGGGKTALEKLNTVLINNPDTKINLIASHIDKKIYQLAKLFNDIKITKKFYGHLDLENIDVVIVAVNNPILSKKIKKDAKKMHKIINVVDTPELCDFYMGSIVQKGNIKIAISTNGKSPIIAKKLKEFFLYVLPNEIDDILINMHDIRNRLKGDFEHKVKVLHSITENWLIENNNKYINKNLENKNLVSYLLVIITLINIVSYFLHTLFINVSSTDFRFIFLYFFNQNFLYLIFTGFFAQLVDGAIGMGYGLTCTTILMSFGIPLSTISASIHTAEIFSSGISGLSHYRMGNVNNKLFKILLIPGILGSIIGAFLLSKFGDNYAFYIKPMLAIYTFFLGIKILLRTCNWNKNNKKIKKIGYLAGLGGFFDSFAGGGWGPFVTSTLISKGRTPKYVIGSVSLSEFFVTLSSTLTFFSLLGINYWKIVFGLVFGGIFAAPIAARISGKLPITTICFFIGILVIIWSIKILYHSIILIFF